MYNAVELCIGSSCAWTYCHQRRCDDIDVRAASKTASRLISQEKTVGRVFVFISLFSRDTRVVREGRALHTSWMSVSCTWQLGGKRIKKCNTILNGMKIRSWHVLEAGNYSYFSWHFETVLDSAVSATVTVQSDNSNFALREKLARPIVGFSSPNDTVDCRDRAMLNVDIVRYARMQSRLACEAFPCPSHQLWTLDTGFSSRGAGVNSRWEPCYESRMLPRWSFDERMPLVSWQVPSGGRLSIWLVLMWSCVNVKIRCSRPSERMSCCGGWFVDLARLKACLRSLFLVA